MRLRIIAILTLLSLLVALVWRFGFHGIHPALILNPRPATRVHHPQLDTIESIDVHNTTLRAVLDELAAKHDFEYRIDPFGFDGGNLQDPISLQLHDVTLRSLLNRIARAVDEDWVVIDAGDHIRFTDRDAWFATETNYVTRFYPVSPDNYVGLSGMHVKPNAEPLSASVMAAALIEEVVQPDHWDTVGGSGSALAYPHGVLVTATPDVHVTVADLLNHLVDGHVGFGTDPIMLARTETDARESLLKEKLQQKADIVFDGATWEEIAQWLSIEHDIPVVFDTFTAWLAFRSTATRFRGELLGVTIAEGLELLLREEELDFEIRNESLMITDRDSHAPRLTAMLHPIGDLVASTSLEGSEIADIVTDILVPDTWDVVGGYGVCRCAGGYLVVQHRPRVHDQLVAVLRSLRAQRVPAWSQLPSTPRGTTGSALEKTLAQPATFDFYDASIAEVAQQLRDQYGIRVWVHARVADQPIETRFTLNASCPTLWQALESLLQGTDVSWRFEGNTLVLTSLEDSEVDMPVRVHNVRAIVQARELTEGVDVGNQPNTPVASLRELIMHSLLPNTWDNVGGPGGIAEIGDCLIVRQSAAGHLRLEQLLISLQQATQNPSTSSVEEVALVPVGADATLYRSFTRRMDEKLSSGFTATTLSEALDEISRRVEFPMRFTDPDDFEFAQRTILSEDGISAKSFQQTGTARRVVLRSILRPGEWCYAFRDGVIWIDSSNNVLQREMCVYPIQDLCQTDPDLAETLVDSLPAWIDPPDWDDYGGTATVANYQGTLVVAAQADTHRKIRGLLAALRDVAAQPQNRATRHIDARLGDIHAETLTLLRQPASSPQAQAVIQRLLPELDDSISLTGISLLVALQSNLPQASMLATDGAEIVFLPEDDGTESLGHQVAVLPIDDLMEIYEPTAQASNRPWYLPIPSMRLGWKGSTPLHSSLDGYLVDFINHLFQYPWDTSAQAIEIIRVGNNLIVATDIGSLWHLEEIVQGLRQLQPNQPLQWSSSYDALHTPISYEFENASLSVIMQQLEQRIGFPVRGGNSIQKSFADACQGTGAVSDLRLAAAFTQISFVHDALQERRLTLKLTPEAILVDTQPQPIQWLQVYDLRALDATYPDLNLALLKQLISEVACQRFQFGVFGVISPSVETVRGFVSVEASTATQADSARLLEILRNRPALIASLSPDRSTAAGKPAEDAVAWIVSALAQPGTGVERRLALWLVGELPTIPAELLGLLEQDETIWKHAALRPLALSAMQRMGKAASPLVPHLLATATDEELDVNERLTLLHLVTRSSSDPVRDMRSLLKLLTQQSQADLATLQTIAQIGALGPDARQLMVDLVELIPINDDNALDSALRNALLRLDPEGEDLPRVVDVWIETHHLSPERAEQWKVNNWPSLPNASAQF